MNRFVLKRNVLALCVLLIALIFTTSFGVGKTEGPEDIVDFDEREYEEWYRAIGFETAMSVAKDRLSEKQYKQTGAEITTWIKDAAFPRPDNAALLYYQAFLLRPEPNMATSSRINEVFWGAEPDRQIRTYLGHCLPMIRLVEIATQIPQCTWGLWDESDPKFRLDLQIRRTMRILALDARTLAVDQHYRAALVRCLTMRRLARHVNNDTMDLLLTSISPDSLALRTIRHVLNVMPPDAEILEWLQGQLTVEQGAPLTFAKTLQVEFETALHRIRTNPDLIKQIRDDIVAKTDGKQDKENVWNLTDEQLTLRAVEPYARFLNSVFRVIESDMFYKQKYAQMQTLTKKLMREHGSDPVVAPFIFLCDPEGSLYQAYPRIIEHVAHRNGLRTALDVFLIVAKTGQLPEDLPDHLPKDPFTDRDFVYEITDRGFALRCQGEEFLRRKNRFLEFKVAK